MSLNNYKNNNEQLNQKKPAYSFFLHISDIDYNSKKHLNAFQFENDYKNIISFDVKKENINGIDFSNSEAEKIKDNIINRNIFNINQSQLISQNRNKNNINSNINQNINKTLLSIPNRGRNKNKNKKNKRNFIISKKNNVNNKGGKGSQSSIRSGNSTKRTNYLLRTHDSPEKYPEDYLSVDSSSDEEKELKKKEMQINQNCNSLFLKNILEKGKNLNSDYNPKKDIENKLQGFDLMSIDLKNMFRDNDFKKKYFKNLKADIKIVYFDKEIVPLHAIFIFNDNRNIKRDKKLFPGAYNKEEFIELCTNMLAKNKSITAELLMDYAELPQYQELETDLNLNLFIDFYFLVDIFNEN